MPSAPLSPRALASATWRYLRRHPGELARSGRAALGGELRVPLALLGRWVEPSGAAGGPGALPRVEPRPPGFRVRHRVNAVGTVLDVVADLVVERIALAPGSIRVRVRAEGVELTAVGKAKAPLKALLDSGAIDFRQIGALAASAPEPHPALERARGDHLELELMRVPAIAADPRVRRLLERVTPWMAVTGVRTTHDAVHLSLAPLPRGARAALRAARGAVAGPGAMI